MNSKFLKNEFILRIIRWNIGAPLTLLYSASSLKKFLDIIDLAKPGERTGLNELVICKFAKDNQQHFIKIFEIHS